MTPNQFIAKWAPVKLSEAASRQEHFLDLCRLLGQPTPAQHDATGADGLENREVFQTPEVAHAGGLAALKTLGKPRKAIMGTKTRTFAA